MMILLLFPYNPGIDLNARFCDYQCYKKIVLVEDSISFTIRVRTAFHFCSSSEFEFPQLEEKMDIGHLNDLMKRFDQHYDEQFASNEVMVLKIN